MHVVIATRLNRPALLAQTVRTLYDNATGPDDLSLRLVVDGWEETDWPGHPAGAPERVTDVTVVNERRGIGWCKNFGASQFHAGPDSLLVFSDDDFYYLPKWDSMARELADYAADCGVQQLGLWSHPYNHLGTTYRIGPTDGGVHALRHVNAVAGGCQLMRWRDWREFGPFPDNAVGVGQSEDFALSQRIVKAGGLIACVDPFLAIHCGLSNSDGVDAVGVKEMRDLATEQIIAYGLEGKVVLR